jgi:hypothetical protein
MWRSAGVASEDAVGDELPRFENSTSIGGILDALIEIFLVGRRGGGAISIRELRIHNQNQ